MLVNLNIYLWPQRIHKLNRKGFWQTLIPEKKQVQQNLQHGAFAILFPRLVKAGNQKVSASGVMGTTLWIGDLLQLWWFADENLSGGKSCQFKPMK